MAAERLLLSVLPLLASDDWRGRQAQQVAEELRKSERVERVDRATCEAVPEMGEPSMNGSIKGFVVKYAWLGRRNRFGGPCGSFIATRFLFWYPSTGLQVNGFHQTTVFTVYSAL